MIIGTGQPLLRELEGCLNMDPRFWSLRNLKRLSVPEKHTNPGFKLRLMLFFREWTNEATLCIDISLMPNVSSIPEPRHEDTPSSWYLWPPDKGYAGHSGR